MSVLKKPAAPGPSPRRRSVPAAELPPDDSRPETAREWIVRVVAAGWMFCFRNPGWGVSILLHALALTLIAIFAIHSHVTRDDSGFDSGFVLSEPDRPFEQIGITDSIEFGQAGSENGQINSLTDALNSGGGGQVQGDLADLMQSIGRGRGRGNGSGDGEGDGDGDGNEPGLGAAFFGSRSAGKTFVFIVDMSGSMIGRRFDRAVKELTTSIQKLNPKQQFYVFFFNDQTYPLFYPRAARSLIPATKSNKDKAARWIRTREPQGLTNPMLSVRQALEFKPEVIYLLTDGEVDNPLELRELIQKNNKSGTTIHTIAFEDEVGGATLEAIAKENKGTFRFVR